LRNNEQGLLKKHGNAGGVKRNLIQFAQVHAIQKNPALTSGS
jgi:hypothetical protein